MYTLKTYVVKPFKVEFLGGSLNGAIRYYSSLRSARSAAYRYVKQPIGGRFIFRFPCCEISFINENFESRFLEFVG